MSYPLRRRKRKKVCYSFHIDFFFQNYVIFKGWGGRRLFYDLKEFLQVFQLNKEIMLKGNGTWSFLTQDT